MDLSWRPQDITIALHFDSINVCTGIRRLPIVLSAWSSAVRTGAV
jgi:hypothetical protein